MENNIYESIAKRSGGDIYIGVVGPVRTGKSTFIARFMQSLVVPAIINKNERQRAIDDTPQSADGKNIMTTQPKFVPSKGVRIQVSKEMSANIRLVDCVGYMVNGAYGALTEEGKTRMVKTPWSDADIPFYEAADIGTKKVINEHSNVGIIVTTDGSIKTDLARANYIEAEERCVNELKALNKPFVIVLNSANPNNDTTLTLAMSLQSKYGVPVIPLNASQMGEAEIGYIFEELIKQFPLSHIDINLPEFLQGLPFENKFIQEIVTNIKQIPQTVKIGDYKELTILNASENFEPASVSQIKMEQGVLVFEVEAKEHLFYKVVSEEVGIEISTQGQLVSQLCQLATIARKLKRFENAIEAAEQMGYGIVAPDASELVLSEPQLLKQGNRFGVKLKATAPSMHIMRVDVETEVNPILGTQQQSEQMLSAMMTRFEEAPTQLWDTNIFGRSLNDIVKEGLSSKLQNMPQNAQAKMRRTTERIINEGKGGVICILL